LCRSPRLFRLPSLIDVLTAPNTLLCTCEARFKFLRVPSSLSRCRAMMVCMKYSAAVCDDGYSDARSDSLRSQYNTPNSSCDRVNGNLGQMFMEGIRFPWQERRECAEQLGTRQGQRVCEECDVLGGADERGNHNTGSAQTVMCSLKHFSLHRTGSCNPPSVGDRRLTRFCGDSMRARQFLPRVKTPV